ncbi:MAG: hypothetical protein ACOCVA_03380 [Prolixibacteraceae bacterium]
MEKLGKKEGLATREEIKTLWKVASGELKIPVMLQPLTNLVVPGIIDGLDNKVGDRIPEPWQTHCENLVTMVVLAVEDKVITQEEVTEIMEYSAKVADERIDLPMLKNDVEAMVFLETFRMAGVLLYGAMTQRKAAA